MIQKNRTFREEADFENQITDIEREKLLYDFLEKQLTLMLESTCKVSDCEVDIIYSESEIVGANIKVSVPEGGIGNDALRTDILEVVSKALDISTESITVSVN